MAVSYATVYVWVLALLGVALLSFGFCFVYYRAVFINAETRVSADADSAEVAQAVVFLYGFYLLPWLGVLFYARHFLVHVGSVVVAPLTLCVQAGLLVTFFIVFILLAWTGWRLVAGRWALELLGCSLILQLCWFILSQGGSVLSFILWLEVITLAGAGLLLTASVGRLELSMGGVVWRATELAPRTSLSFLLSLNIFFWTGGFATVLLMWGLLCGTPAAGTTLYLIFEATGAQSRVLACWKTSALAELTGAGILIKFMLQPCQLALFAFYQCLPMEAFSLYLLVYYSYLLPLFFLVFLPQLRTLFIGWELLLIASTCAATAFVVHVSANAHDVRSALTYSTVINLSLLIAALNAV